MHPLTPSPPLTGSTLAHATAMALGLALSAAPAQAQLSPLEPALAAPQPPPLPAPEAPQDPEARSTELLLYTSAQRLSGGLGDWSEVGVRGSYTTGAHVLQGELATMKRFGESGRFIGIGDTWSFDADWFGSLSVGAGDGASYLPDFRVDAFLHRKLLAERNLIASLGVGHYRAPDGHTDRSLSIGGTYYFSGPWIVQGEVRLNRSNPGSVDTQQQFLALTWGRDQQTQVTARHAWGGEGYQTIGAGTALTNFKSHQTSLNLRHWLGADWGVVAGVERYSNPFYRRRGATLALFWELP